MLRSAPFFLGLIPFLFQGADAHLPGTLALLSNLFFLTSLGLELIHIVSLPAYRTPVAVQLTCSALSHVHLPLWHLSIRSTLHRTFHCHNALDELISPAVPGAGTNPAFHPP